MKLLNFLFIVSVLIFSPKANALLRVVEDWKGKLNINGFIENVGSPEPTCFIEESLLNLKPSSTTVKECLNDPSIPEGKWIKVNETKSDLCKKNPWYLPDIKHERTSNYSIAKINGKIKVRVNLDFKYKGALANFAVARANLNKALACTSDFYKANGIDLEINQQVDLPPRSGSIKINLWDKLSENATFGIAADANNWPLVKKQSEHLDFDRSKCKLIAHELSHHLGLPDRYRMPLPDGDNLFEFCPDQDLTALGPEKSLMNKAWSDILYSTLEPRDISIILDPLCKRK